MHEATVGLEIVDSPNWTYIKRWFTTAEVFGYPELTRVNEKTVQILKPANNQTATEKIRWIGTRSGTRTPTRTVILRGVVFVCANADTTAEKPSRWSRRRKRKSRPKWSRGSEKSWDWADCLNRRPQWQIPASVDGALLTISCDALCIFAVGLQSSHGQMDLCVDHLTHSILHGRGEDKIMQDFKQTKRCKLACCCPDLDDGAMARQCSLRVQKNIQENMNAFLLSDECKHRAWEIEMGILEIIVEIQPWRDIHLTFKRFLIW